MGWFIQQPYKASSSAHETHACPENKPSQMLEVFKSEVKNRKTDGKLLSNLELKNRLVNKYQRERLKKYKKHWIKWKWESNISSL